MPEEHTRNARPSNRKKHQDGQARKKKDSGGEKGEKGDKRRKRQKRKRS